MKVTLGKEGLAETFQNPFPENTKCVHCDGESRIGFVAHEGNEDIYLCDLHDNEGDYWLHDACCVAVYFCRKCLETTSLYNQA